MSTLVRLARRFLLAGILGCGIAAAAIPEGSGTVALNIEPQPIRAALELFASQTGLQVVLRDEDLRAEGVMASRVVGELSVQQALGKLLAGTDLQYEFVNPRTVKISKPGKLPARGAARAEDSGRQMRLARADEPAKDKPEKAAADAPDTRGIPEILVKGSRTSNTDIRRTEDDVQPYVVFDAEDIKRSMAGNLEDFLKTRLPMDTTATTNTQGVTDVVFQTYGTQSSINLRGLGANQTLILVNGRRMPSVYDGVTLLQPDINGIPLSSVERVEVLPSTAGGIYGGGATGGVVNIILKRDFRGFEVNARYDNTFDTDVARRYIEGMAGFSLEGGRTQVMMSASHSDAASFTVGDRDFLRQARQRLRENDPGRIFDFFIMPMAATANFRSLDGSELVLQSTGQSLNSSFGYVPYGYAGPESDGGRALLNTAGDFNTDLPTGLLGLKGSMLAEPTVDSVSLNVRRSFTDRIEAFLDASLNQNDSHGDYGTFPYQSIYLSADAPNNPFGQDIEVQFAAPDLRAGSDLTADSDTLTVSGGLMFRLPHDWTLQAEHSWARSRTDSSLSVYVLTDEAFVAMADGGLDILRDVTAHPLDYSPYLYTPTPNYYLLKPQELVMQDSILRFAGPLLKLPGGALTLSTMFEHRQDDAKSAITVGYFAPDEPTYLYSPPRGQKTDSGYVEATAPLISAANARRWVRAFDLQGSYRYDKTTTRTLLNTTFLVRVIPSPQGPFPTVQYATNEVTANQYTLGLRYKPAEALALRVSYGAGILPPSIDQLVPQIQRNYNLSRFGIIDPKRGNNLAGIVPEFHIFGNPDLLPEQSRSWSGGIVFTPKSLPGLRTSIDYTRITKADEITLLQFQQLFTLEDKLPGRIVRAALTAQDQARGYTGGVIQLFDLSNINLAHSRVEAYDIQTDYRWTTAFGDFTANLLATYTNHLQRQVTAQSSIEDSAGYAFGPLKWRGNGGLTWERGPWTAAWNMQFYDSYLVYDASYTQDLIDDAVRMQGDDRIPRQVYHDLYFKYRFGHATSFGGRALADTEITVGFSNVFNTSPPIVVTDNPAGYGYSTYGDPRLRRYSISVHKSF